MNATEINLFHIHTLFLQIVDLSITNMPGGDVYTESLEQRIERIRKSDEEIEKKHREAEADRLAYE